MCGSLPACHKLTPCHAMGSVATHRPWLRGRDLNPRPSGYEPDELPDCSTSQNLVSVFPDCHPRREVPTTRLSGVVLFACGVVNRCELRTRDGPFCIVRNTLAARYHAHQSADVHRPAFRLWCRGEVGAIKAFLAQIRIGPCHLTRNGLLHPLCQFHLEPLRSGTLRRMVLRHPKQFV